MCPRDAAAVKDPHFTLVCHRVPRSTVVRASGYNGRHFGVLNANFIPHLYNTTPSPYSMLDFLSLEFAFFLYNTEKGEGGGGGGVGSQSIPDLKWNT